MCDKHPDTFCRACGLKLVCTPNNGRYCIDNVYPYHVYEDEDVLKLAVPSNYWSCLVADPDGTLFHEPVDMLEKLAMEARNVH